MRGKREVSRESDDVSTGHTCTHTQRVEREGTGRERREDGWMGGSKVQESPGPERNGDGQRGERRDV